MNGIIQLQLVIIHHFHLIIVLGAPLYGESNNSVSSHICVQHVRRWVLQMLVHTVVVGLILQTNVQLVEMVVEVGKANQIINNVLQEVVNVKCHQGCTPILVVVDVVQCVVLQKVVVELVEPVVIKSTENEDIEDEEKLDQVKRVGKVWLYNK